MNESLKNVIEMVDRFKLALKGANSTIALTNNNLGGLNEKLNSIGETINLQNKAVQQLCSTINTSLGKIRQANKSFGIHRNTFSTKNVPLNAARKHIGSLLFSGVNNSVHNIEKGGLDSLNLVSGMFSKTGSGFAGLSGNFKGGGVYGMIAMLGTKLIESVSDLIKRIFSAAKEFTISSIIKKFERQRIQNRFNILAGDEQGNMLHNQLVGLKKSTGLGNEVFESADTLLTMGFNPVEIPGIVRMLADVAIGDPERLSRLTDIYSRIRSEGTVTESHLNQLEFEGFDVLATMADKSSRSISVLQKELKNGKISFKDVELTLKSATSEGGRFHNVLEKIAGTPLGKMEKLSARWEEIKVKSGEAFMPLLSVMADIAEKFMPKIEKFVGFLGLEMNRIADFIRNIKIDTSGWAEYTEMIKDFYENTLRPCITAIAGLIKSSLSTLIEFLGESELVKDIFREIKWVYEKIFDGIKLVTAACTWIIDNVIKPQLKLMDLMYKTVKTLAGIEVKNFNPLRLFAGEKPAPIPLGENPANPLLNSRTTVVDPGIPQKFLQGLLGNLPGLFLKTHEDAGKPAGNLNLPVPKAVAKDNSSREIQAKTLPSGLPNSEILVKNGLEEDNRKDYSALTASTTANNIATGGIRHTNITVNLGNLVETMHVTASNITESAEKVRDVVIDELSRALLMAQANV